MGFALRFRAEGYFYMGLRIAHVEPSFLASRRFGFRPRTSVRAYSTVVSGWPYAEEAPFGASPPIVLPAEMGRRSLPGIDCLALLLL